VRIVFPGIAGGIGRKLALRLLEGGHQIEGIDVRPWPDAPKEITFHQVDIRKRGAEEVFRRVRPEAVIHMATVTSLTVRGEERHRINLGGTRAVFEHARTYGAKHCIFVGRHTFYGAAPDSPLFHTEDEPPMALSTFPELADLVAADLFAATALWRYPEMVTAVLRVCYTLGPTGHGTLATYLRGSTVPTLLGFDPLFQFMHEDDVVTSIALALERRLRGIFNVAGPPPVPFSIVVRETGRKLLRLPEFLVQRALGRWGLPALPRGALSHVKYPVVVDAAAFRKATGFRHLYDEVETLAAFRRAFPPPVRGHA